MCEALSVSAKHAVTPEVGLMPRVRELDWDDGLEGWVHASGEPGLIDNHSANNSITEDLEDEEAPEGEVAAEEAAAVGH